MPVLPDDDLPDTDEGIVDPNDYFTAPSGAPVPTAYAAGTALAPSAAKPAPAPKPATETKPAKSRSQQLLDEATQIAQRQNRPPTIMDGILAGLSAKPSGPVASQGGVALMQGFVTGLTGGVAGRKRTDDTDKQFDRTYKLYQAERQIENDADSKADRERRTSAYEESVRNRGTGTGGGRPMHPLQAQKYVRDGVAAKRKELGLDADDEKRPRYKMPPEERARREKLVEEYEAELNRLANGGLPAGPTAGTSPAPAPAPRTPAPAVTPGPSPTAVNARPPGASEADLLAATEEALSEAGSDAGKRQKILERARSWGLPGY